MNEEQAKWYLAGIIDGEGSISTGQNKMIRIRVCDKDIIEACIKALKILGIKYKVYWDWKPSASSGGSRDYHELRINGQNSVKKLQSLIPIQNAIKRGKLEYAANSYEHLPYSEDQISNRVKDKILTELGLI